MGRGQCVTWQREAVVSPHAVLVAAFHTAFLILPALWGYRIDIASHVLSHEARTDVLCAGTSSKDDASDRRRNATTLANRNEMNMAVFGYRYLKSKVGSSEKMAYISNMVKSHSSRFYYHNDFLSDVI